MSVTTERVLAGAIGCPLRQPGLQRIDLPCCVGRLAEASVWARQVNLGRPLTARDGYGIMSLPGRLTRGTHVSNGLDRSVAL